MVDLVTDCVKSLLFIYLFLVLRAHFWSAASSCAVFFDPFPRLRGRAATWRPRSTAAACGAAPSLCHLLQSRTTVGHDLPAPRCPSELIPLTEAVPGGGLSGGLAAPSAVPASASPRPRPAAGRAGP